jgi:hypothetical protein
MPSSYYIITHHFHLGKQDEWWGKIQEAMSSPQTMKAMHDTHHEHGFHNHSFMPCSLNGPMFCIWEAAEGKSAADMQAFIDGEAGPGMGCMNNTCVQINTKAAGNAPYPSFFEKPTPVSMPASETKRLVKLFDDFQKKLMTGEAAECCEEGALFNPPGAPPMPIDVMSGMCKTTAVAFPDWSGRTLGVTKMSDNTYTVLTQQVAGAMQADMEAMGPFPAVALADAPDVCKDKEKGVAFPVEVGTYTLSADRKKIVSGTYEGATKDGVKGQAAVTPEVAAEWDKSGDKTDVGFGALFKVMGVSLPAPPKEEEEAEDKRRVTSSRFFVVHHRFLAGGRGKEWWGQAQGLFSDPAKMGAMVAKQHELGFHGHMFMPRSAGTEEDIYCVWEMDMNAAEGKSAADFQAFIDGEAGPGMGCMNNDCFEVDMALTGGSGPAEPHFEQAAEAAAQPLKTKKKWKKLFRLFKSKKTSKGSDKAEASASEAPPAKVVATADDCTDGNVAQNTPASP